MRKNTDQKNSEYGHLSRSDYYHYSLIMALHIPKSWRSGNKKEISKQVNAKILILQDFHHRYITATPCCVKICINFNLVHSTKNKFSVEDVFGRCEQKKTLTWNLFCVESVRIWSFSGPNARKYGPEKLRIRTRFMQWGSANL